MPQWNFLERERTIHSLKTALACLLGYILTKSFHFYVDQWLIVSIVVVMCAQINVGSFIQKSSMRLLGTLLGSLIAAFSLLVFGNHTLATGLTIVLATAFFSYIATGQKSYSDAGALGAVTVIIILINQNPDLRIAVIRFTEISIGILIAALITQFILPIHARKHLRLNQATTFRQLSTFYLAMLLTDYEQENVDNYQLLDEEIVQSLIKQRKLAADAAREPFGTVFDPKYFDQLLQCEKGLLRSIVAMHQAYMASLDSRHVLSSMDLLQDFHDVVRQALQKIALYMEFKRHKKMVLALPNIELLRKGIVAHSKKLSQHEHEYVYAFLFSAETLLNYIERIEQLINRMHMASQG